MYVRDRRIEHAPWVLALQAVALVACFAVPLRTDVGVAKPAPPVSGAP